MTFLKRRCVEGLILWLCASLLVSLAFNWAVVQVVDDLAATRTACR